MNEIDDIFQGEVNESAGGGGGQWRSQPGVAVVKIHKIETGVTQGQKPYFDVHTIGTEDNLQSTIRLWRVHDSNSEKANVVKRGIMKEFFSNTGVVYQQGMSLEQYLNAMTGAALKVLFRQEEYIATIKDQNNKPEIKTKIEYAFSKPISEELTFNQSYLFRPLRQEEKSRFNGLLQVWQGRNPHLVQQPTTTAAAPVNNVQQPVQQQQTPPQTVPTVPMEQPAAVQQPVQQQPAQNPAPHPDDKAPWEQEDDLPY
ncbi:MAG: hypothetical protein ACTSPB_10860 [Candidatus Thorarchaeota archaeon]